MQTNGGHITGNGNVATERRKRHFVVIRGPKGKRERCQRAIRDLFGAVLDFSLHLADDHGVPVDLVPDYAAQMLRDAGFTDRESAIELYELCRERGYIL